MSVNKVEFSGETLIDISDSTVTADSLLEGTIAYGADGSKIEGILQAMGGGKIVNYGNVSVSPTSGAFSISFTFSEPFQSNAYYYVIYLYKKRNGVSYNADHLRIYTPIISHIVNPAKQGNGITVSSVSASSTSLSITIPANENPSKDMTYTLYVYAIEK